MLMEIEKEIPGFGSCVTSITVIAELAKVVSVGGVACGRDSCRKLEATTWNRAGPMQLQLHAKA